MDEKDKRRLFELPLEIEYLEISLINLESNRRIMSAWNVRLNNIQEDIFKTEEKLKEKQWELWELKRLAEGKKNLEWIAPPRQEWWIAKTWLEARCGKVLFVIKEYGSTAKKGFFGCRCFLEIIENGTGLGTFFRAKTVEECKNHAEYLANKED